MGIGVAVTLRDNFSSRANSISASMGRMHSNVRQVMTDNLRAVRNLSLGVATASSLLLSPLSNAVRAGSQFNYIMASVDAVTQDSLVSLRALHDQALGISRETIHTANEIGDAMKFLGMAGFNTKQISESIRAISYLGAATDTAIGGIGGAADIASNIMQQFNIDARQSMRVADLLTATTTRANTNLTQLGEAVYYAGGQFAALKVPMEEVLAMAGVMSGAGYRGSFAGTAMMNMAQQLVKALGEFSTKRQQKILNQMGLTPKDVFQVKNGIVELLPFYEVIQNMSEKIQKGVPGAAQIEGFFQKRGMRAFVALLRDPKIGMNLKEFTKFLETRTTGSALSVAQKRLENHYGQVKIMESAWNTFRITVAEALFPILIPMVKVLTSIANVMVKITSNPIGKWATVFAVGAWAIVTVGAALLFVFSSIATMAMRSTVTFANMGRTLTWAWNSAAAAAMRYALVQRGVSKDMVLNSAGRWIDRSTGRFVKGPATGGTGGLLGRILAPLLRGLASFGGVIRSIIPMLSRLGSVLSGPIGWLVGIVTLLVGFKNIINGVIYAFGTLIQATQYYGEVTGGILKNLLTPWNWGSVISDANKNFGARQTVLRGAVEFEGEGPIRNTPSNRYTSEFSEDLARQWQNMQLTMVAKKLDITGYEARRRYMEGSLNINSVLEVDGRALAKSQQEFSNEELARILQ